MDRELTADQIKAIEDTHNVYIDRDTMQYNVGGGYDAVYCWQPIPTEWIDEAEENH